MCVKIDTYFASGDLCPDPRGRSTMQQAACSAQLIAQRLEHMFGAFFLPVQWSVKGRYGPFKLCALVDSNNHSKS